MSLYRCAACGSPRVIEDTQMGGYNYIKGAVGTMVLGAGGAAAGINGNKTKVYKCPDCGLTLNEPMPFEIKILIDMGVDHESARNNLMLRGTKIDWEYLVNKYKNIETKNSSNDKAASENKMHISTRSASLSTEELAKNAELYKAAEEEYRKLCQKWFDKIQHIKRIREKEQIESLELEVERLQKSALDAQEHEIQTHKSEKEKYLKRLTDAKERLEKLGIFHFSEKASEKQEIRFCTQQIEKEEALLTTANEQYNMAIKDIDQTIDKLKEKLTRELEQKYPFPSKPMKPDNLFRYKPTGEEIPQFQTAMFAHAEIFCYIEEKGSATLHEIAEHCGYSSIKVSNWLNQMVDSYELIAKNEVYAVCYDIQCFLDKPKLELAQKRVQEERVQKRENERQIVLDVLTNFGKLSISEMKEKSADLSKWTESKISAVLRIHIDAGKVVRTVNNGQVYFEITK